MYINNNIKFWLKIILPTVIVLQIFYTSLTHSIYILPNFKNIDIWIILNYIGAYCGISALMFSLAKQEIINSKTLGILIGIGFIVVLYSIVIKTAYANPSSNFIMMVAPLGGYVFIQQLFFLTKKKNLEQVKLYFLLTAIFILMAWGTQTALEIIKFIFPHVYDINVYKIDAAFGNVTIPIVQWFDTAPALLQTFVLEIYSFLSIFLFIVVALFIRENKAKQYHIIRVLIVPFGLAFLLYSIIPVAGPIYAFATQYFPLNMPTVNEMQGGTVFIPPAARNGMPSMHLTGALLIWLLSAGLSRKIYFYAATIFLCITAFATIALGEHYLLDLIVALPFAAFIAVSLANPNNFIFKNKKITILWIGAGVTFALWILLLLVASEWLYTHLWFVQIFAAWSVIIATSVFTLYIQFVWHDKPVVETTQEILELESNPAQTTPKWIIGVFVASGFAGLLYEVVYAKSLAVTFGSTSLASYTVLTTYMSGMALGAWVGGYIADKVKKPLLYYVGIEAFIGVYAVITPFLFKFIQNIYVSSIANLAADDPKVTFLRVALGVIVLGIPTILMGATMPIMFKYLKQLKIQSDTAISRLYSANVIGAALGSFIGGYFFIPAVGRIGATNLAAVFSLMIALYTIEQFKKVQHVALHEDADILSQTAIENKIPKILGMAALVILTIGGAVTLGLEVVSIHMLAVVAGNSVYAFALMLAVFLLGLGCGSVFGKKALNYIDRTTLIVIAQCGIAGSILLTALLWDKIPAYFASFGDMQQYIYLGFWAREILRGAVCALAMFPATLFIGASYPATMSLAADWLGNRGDAKGLGAASALNTTGNIAGVLLVGFLLLPTFGSNKVFLLLAIVSTVLAILMFVCSIKLNKERNYYPVAVIASVLLLFVVYPKNWNFSSLAQGANVYFMPTYWGEVIDHTESIEGGVTSVARSPDGKYLTLLTNGKFQGNNSGETLAQESFALIPLLHNSERKNALAIGFGTGMTSRVLHEQGFKTLDIVELSKDIVYMSDKYFSDINHSVTKQSGVNLIYTDGRNYLLTQDKKYDLISLEITSIWFAGAASLYNKEFYELSKKRLEHDGVLQQWVQLHHMHPIDLVYILNTVRSVYPYVWLYESGGQGVIIASESENAINTHHLSYPYGGLSLEQLQEKENMLKGSVVLSPKGIDNLALKTDKTLRHLISTDNNLYLEYATPKGNAIMEDALTQNLEYLRKFEK